MSALRAISIGVAAGALAWWAAAPRALPADAARLAKAPLNDVRSVDPAVLLASQVSGRGGFQVFPPPTGAPMAEASALRLIGTAVSPARRAALVSVGGATPQWLAVGAPAQGLELVEVASARAVIRTASGDTVTLDLFPHKPEASAVVGGASHGG